MLSTLICFIVKMKLISSFVRVLDLHIKAHVLNHVKKGKDTSVHFLTALPDTAYLIWRTLPEGSDRLVAPEIKSR